MSVVDKRVVLSQQPVSSMTSISEEEPRVLVVSACSKRKSRGEGAPEASRDTLPARDRYAGRAHLRVREAVDRWRASRVGGVVEWSIVSAGCGLVGEHEQIPDYEATFGRLGRSRASSLASELGIPHALLDQLATFDVALFVLPLAYLRATAAPFGQPGRQLYFTSPAFGIRDSATLLVPCGLTQAREMKVTAREVAAARFSMFVNEVIADGLSPAIHRWEARERAR